MPSEAAPPRGQLKRKAPNLFVRSNPSEDGRLDRDEAGQQIARSHVRGEDLALALVGLAVISVPRREHRLDDRLRSRARLSRSVSTQ